MGISDIKCGCCSALDKTNFRQPEPDANTVVGALQHVIRDVARTHHRMMAVSISYITERQSVHRNAIPMLLGY